MECPPRWALAVRGANRASSRLFPWLLLLRTPRLFARAREMCGILFLALTRSEDGRRRKRKMFHSGGGGCAAAQAEERQTWHAEPSPDTKARCCLDDGPLVRGATRASGDTYEA